MTRKLPVKEITISSAIIIFLLVIYAILMGVILEQRMEQCLKEGHTKTECLVIVKEHNQQSTDAFNQSFINQMFYYK